MQVNVQFDQDWLQNVVLEHIKKLEQVREVHSLKLKVKRYSRFGTLLPIATAETTDDQGRKNSLRINTDTCAIWIQDAILEAGLKDEWIKRAILVCSPGDDGLRSEPEGLFFLDVDYNCRVHKNSHPPRSAGVANSGAARINAISEIKFDQRWMETVLLQNIKKFEVVAEVISLELKVCRGNQYPDVRTKFTDKYGRKHSAFVYTDDIFTWFTDAVLAEGYRNVRSARIVCELRDDGTGKCPDLPFAYEVEYNPV